MWYNNINAIERVLIFGKPEIYTWHATNVLYCLYFVTVDCDLSYCKPSTFLSTWSNAGYTTCFNQRRHAGKSMCILLENFVKYNIKSITYFLFNMKVLYIVEYC